MKTVCYVIYVAVIVGTFACTAFGIWRGETAFLVKGFTSTFERFERPALFWSAIAWNFLAGLLLAWLVYKIWRLQ